MEDIAKLFDKINEFNNSKNLIEEKTKELKRKIIELLMIVWIIFLFTVISGVLIALWLYNLIIGIL